MKILAIRGKNLASLEGEFDIDFTTEPLKSTGTFAITGPTGAGKSTILDALCLALFDDAPRLNKAETSVNLADVEDKTITQRDCRNILRRGSSEGYAEVEFMALNGDRYRSRWTVRRARGKVEGALQATTLKVENLSTGSEVQGTKKELLLRITEVIGLTFDQFTRAVLLAQGDFATFLKAKQNEKAELLEKLTGTEVYSRISSLIYQRTIEARNDLERLNHRIADIKLLDDEELDVLNKEKEKLAAETEPLKIRLTSINRKIEWLTQADKLKEEIRQADLQLLETRDKIRQAAPRYEYLAMIDTSQEIRDSYIDLFHKQKNLRSLTEQLQLRQEELRKAADKFALADARLKKAEAQLKETEQKYNLLKPEIAAARELDNQIIALREKIIGTKRELREVQLKHEACQKNVAACQRQLDENVKAKTNLQNWFETNQSYKDIVARYDLIVAMLNDANTTKEQLRNTKTSLETGKQLSETYTTRRKQLEEEALRLNTLLPTEVINLRKKLTAGEPCPVCGSTEHPMHTNHIQTMDAAVNEEELEKAKSALLKSMEDNAKSLEDTLKNITVLETYVSNYQKTYDSTVGNLNTYLQGFPEWQTKFGRGTLQRELLGVVTAWNENQSNLTKCEQSIENATLKLSMEQKNLTTLTDELKIKSDLYDEQGKAGKALTEDRSKLLGGKTIDEVEEFFAQQRRTYTNEYNKLRDEKEKDVKEQTTITTIIGQLKKDIETCMAQVAEQEKAVAAWLERKDHAVTADLLKDLISKSAEWIKQERAYLTGIKEQELILSTTLQEKNNRFKQHSESPDKPGEEEDKDSLVAASNETSIQQETVNKRLTEIEVMLATHQNGKQKIKSIESELNTKNELYNNWAKLNELLGSAKGDKFKTIAQGYTLDVLLTYANKHLSELTGRYKLEKVPGTLALQVVDNDMLGEVRTVHSLSGGESFLISLSLALGLSALSSNRMKIESLFIDEGFGALDIDTLNVAMDALDNLQTQGRKIGVISHVEEMKERVNVQIQVIKASNGRSRIRILS